MPRFATLPLPAERTVVAPDGSDVRVLLGLAAGGMAHFSLAAGQVAAAVTHRTVEEIWYVLAGAGQMWRRQVPVADQGATAGGTAGAPGGADDRVTEEITALRPGLCLTIPLGTHFQFRAAPDQALAVVAITMPPWPGEGEAVAVTGPWPVST